MPQQDLYLQHYGVLGMHWGIRRYQNKDGSLTSKGRKHVSWLNKRAKKSDAKRNLYLGLSKYMSERAKKQIGPSKLGNYPIILLSKANAKVYEGTAYLYRHQAKKLVNKNKNVILKKNA